MDFTQSMDNGYMIPSSVAVGSGEATDIRCVCDTVEDFKAFLDTTGMELRYEGLVTYEKINKLLKVYKGNNEWQVVGEGGESVDTSSFITLTQLSQQLSNYYTKAQTDNKISEEIAKAQIGGEGEVDLSDYYTKEEVNDKLGNKDYKYLTQNEYDLLSNEEKNNESIVYFITDSKEDVFSLKLVGNTLSLLKNGISISDVTLPNISSDETPDEEITPPDEEITPPDEDEGNSIEFTNYIYNSDTFVNPTTGNATLKSQYYAVSTGVDKNVNNGVWELTVNELASTKNIQIKHGFADGKVYYVQYKIKTNSPVSAGSSQKMETVSASDNWNTISYLYTDSSASQGFIKVATRAETSIGALIQIKEPMKINLTELYGSGNEPTKEECDAIFVTYKSGLVG